jgi:hypothetical protein
VSRRDRVFPLITPELNQNVMFLIEEIKLILSYSIGISKNSDTIKLNLPEYGW